MKRPMAMLATIIGGIFAFLSMRWLTKSRETTRWVDAAAPGKFVTVDGVSVHYVESKPQHKEAQAILMIHGFGGHTFSFRKQFAEFGREFRCVAIDLKGFGFSERPAEGDYSLTGQANLVLHTMDALGIGRAILIGHSMGGDVAMRVAAAAPERVEKLVLVAAAPGRKVWLAPRFGPAHKIMPGITRLTAWNSWRKMFYDRSQVDTQAVRKGYMEPVRIIGSMDTVWQMWRDVRHDRQVQYERLVMPVLILWAEKDGILPFPGYALKWLRKQIPHAEVHTVPRTGHLVLEENPEESNRLLRAFIGSPVSDAGEETERVRQSA